MNHGWDNLIETAPLRALKQWCVSGGQSTPNLKAPMRELPDGKLALASVINPSHWTTYDEAKAIAARNPGTVIGFVLTPTDPFTVIDLDIKNEHNESNAAKWTSPEALSRALKIYEHFDSFTETSLSGQGCHIWVQGKIGPGVKRDGVEVYSQDRYIICTGTVVSPVKPIQRRQEMLDNMVVQMRDAGQKIPLLDAPQEEEDQVILTRAAEAENGDKFRALWDGSALPLYPSPSEADLALMSMLAFYSPNNEQCIRLFRMSHLGQRAKAQRRDAYLLNTLQTTRTSQIRRYEDIILGREAAGNILGQFVAQQEALAERVEVAREEVRQIIAQSEFEYNPDDAAKYTEENKLPFPPGMAGEIARYLHSVSPRPVQAIATVSTLGLLAGICGRSYRWGSAGLNNYILLVAASGVGKESMHNGVTTLVSHVIQAGVPVAASFVHAGDIASGPALVNLAMKRKSFVALMGEIGHTFQSMGSHGDTGASSLRRKMTELYQRNDIHSYLSATAYSKTEGELEAVQGGVSFSLLGDTTPGTLYDNLDETMLADGFLSRFVIVEAGYYRAPFNEASVRPPPTEIIELLCGMVTQAETMQIREIYQPIAMTAEANQLISEYEIAMTNAIIDARDNEAERQLHNRSHLKVAKIASLLAIADNYVRPIMTADHFLWAKMLVEQSSTLIKQRLHRGEIGKGDDARDRQILTFLRDFFTLDNPTGYGIDPKTYHALKLNLVVPRRYLIARSLGRAVFRNHSLGATFACDASLKSLVDSGKILEISPKEARQQYGPGVGRAFHIDSKETLELIGIK